MEQNKEQREQLTEAAQGLVKTDNPNNLLKNLTEIYVVWNMSDHADCKDWRTEIAGTYLAFFEFLMQLPETRKTN